MQRRYRPSVKGQRCEKEGGEKGTAFMPLPTHSSAELSQFAVSGNIVAIQKWKETVIVSDQLSSKSRTAQRERERDDSETLI